MTWPMPDFDNLRRLRVLHQATPGSLIAETVLDAPFSEVWSALDDVESSFPGLLPDVRSIDVMARDGDRIRADVRGWSGLRARFDLVMRPGWCAMQSRFLMFAMAAEPDGEHTRFGYATSLRLPARRFLAPALRPIHGLLARRTLRRFEARFSRTTM